ncbi:Methyltransferase domain-containing protein [Halogranum amylolyticum]|uniref:Methyltransferase domain-containing protein n=1 Tax=Halogranum amylolyticum TaxID=660520 RepID=A0A1H8R725_9EURY|nr:class I SAM-dependent methyltransferase [Halogranum amylolyticum]SEO62180.1 Methyltransferase domain-containing protein [Halogranum amylolyticum]
MVSDEEDPDADRAPTSYDRLADRATSGEEGWESPWATNPLQQYYSWPATTSLLPDIDGKRVLDAGCGIGDHVEWLLDEGAGVVGVDASERAVEVAHDRFGERATFHCADLTDGLGFAADSGFDVVLSHLVLDHVETWQPVFEAFQRVLEPGGVVVFSIVHPMHYYRQYETVTDYWTRTPVELAWEDAPVTSYHRPVSDVVEAVIETGFRLGTLDEPRPPAAYVEEAPPEWGGDERPQVLCVRARTTAAAD